MSTAIKQVVTVQPGGLIEVRSPELHAGDQAEVTVVVTQSTASSDAAVSSAGGGWRRYAGAIDSSDARAGDHERIDADLADEYGGARGRGLNAAGYVAPHRSP